MNRPTTWLMVSTLASVALLAWCGFAQQPPDARDDRAQGPPSAERNQPPGDFRGPGGPGWPGRGFGGGFGGPDRGFGGPGMGAGFGGPMRQKREVLEQYDHDNDGWLNQQERAEARVFLRSLPPPRGGFGPPPAGGFGPPPGGGFGPPPGAGPGRFGGPFGQREPARPGAQISPGDVQPAEGELYEASLLRTLFLDFENDDWELELSEFRDTDVEVPATLTVDGKRYPMVGVHFRGNSSYMMVPPGYKRSLNLSLDLVDKDQRLLGYKTLNLLNGAEDDSLLSTVLYSHIAADYLPTPKANLVRVVINGENWGIYSNVQQFNKEFLSEHYDSAKGTRWKVPGSPNARGGLEYLGDEIEPYRALFEMKGSDDKKAWRKLIELCRVLDQTPPDELAEAILPLVDIDELLWFLAIDVAVINSDGYWTRASDYSIWLDKEGRFHFFPYDMNEAFRAAGGSGGPGGVGGPGGPRGPFGPGRPRGSFGQGGPGGPIGERGPNGEGVSRGTRGPGGPGGQGGQGGPGRSGGPFGPERGPMPAGADLELDPLVGLDNPRMPLRSKVLAVPEFRRQYLENLRTLAEKSMTWEVVAPVVASYRELVAEEVAAETRKLGTLEAFLNATSDSTASDDTTSDRATSSDAERAGRETAATEPAPAFGPPRFGPRQVPIREFMETRSRYLLRRTAELLAESPAESPANGEGQRP